MDDISSHYGHFWQRLLAGFILIISLWWTKPQLETMKMLLKSIVSLFFATSLIDGFKISPRSKITMMNTKLDHDHPNKILKSFAGFGGMLLISGSLFSVPLPSHAQIPSMDEYNTGSGTVLPGRKRVTGPVVVAATVPDTFSVKRVKESLSLIDKCLSNDPAKWDEIARTIKTTPKFSTKNLGFSSSAELASNYQIDATQAKGVEAAREDFAFNYGLLNDLALANREYFFNKADLEQTQLLKDSADLSSSTAVKEGKEIFKDVLTSFANLESVLTPQ
jgi:hypothetical protein